MFMSHIRIEYSMFMQTDRVAAPVPCNQSKQKQSKAKKLKTKARSLQVAMSDSHLDLETLRQQETERQ